MTFRTAYFVLLTSLVSISAKAMPQDTAPNLSDTAIKVSVQIHGERFPAYSTFDQSNQGQQYEWHLLTKKRLPDGNIQETPNGWSITLNKIESELVSLSVTFTEQGDSETFLFEKTPQETPQCQRFPFEHNIIHRPVICISTP
ncbi:TPA: hypothetical protein ACF311_004302 [Vibrio parahaemolyticus]|uniref:hypothetical protein n=1 Tax=Vibrio parahaemolyticus TaxID=670 RepID=UPI002AC5F5E7|nr:hypothetical protein [Vibrio parahaemolyticus]MDZ5120762.1 hypothetical protein [Vibrio parahaemolyticus]HCH1122012.1 hypothetical protein [Vibrio parahaemolyticus]HCH4062420.1 hypothetical protein [Vibrio parahaemolyticus]